MAIKNKNEIEIFYKTHNLSKQEVAKHFNIPYRTLAYWIKKENWKQGQALSIDEIHNPQVIKNTNRVLNIAEDRIKEQIKTNLGECAFNVDSMILNNLLQSSTDEILLKTMSVNFIQKNIALCAILAKDHLLRLAHNDNGDPKNSPIFIACAEKEAKIFADMKTQIYGKDTTLLQDQSVVEYEKLTLQELNALIEQEQAQGE